MGLRVALELGDEEIIIPPGTSDADEGERNKDNGPERGQHLFFLTTVWFLVLCDVVNQKVLIAVVILALLGASAYLVLSKKGTGPPTTSSPSASGGNVFSSIKDALSKSLSLECTFTDEGGRQTKSFLKNGAVRADITAKDPKQSGSVIVKAKTMYFWNGKTGFMMQIPEETGTPSQAGTKGSEPENANIMDTMEKFKDSCKPAVVADSLFTPPSDVTFQDFSKMMQPPQGSQGGNAAPSIDYSKFLPTGEPPASE